MGEWAERVAHLWKRVKKKAKELRGESTIPGISDHQKDTIAMSIAKSVQAAFKKTRYRERKTP
ncbi:MAG: hypothetical protein J7K68_06415 [Candidatus Diapherotrites archaeon]|nr:hypothetical protein [Candidatus Diapherotrites archaeon]